MTDTFELNDRQILLKASSDRVVAERVVRHIQRRLDEDDWRPYTCKADAVQAWFRLGGIRAQVLRALNLV
ncbi:hypothetical protein SynA1562_01129 [Synechococcus sp. A15-62]|uniref:hypothetical protein n=1 Tax=Synechococcus sp. A15-62 TaxID=1050657 RepID=UPI00164548BD|nr:hypothetical protein [Synechococcus sp. A15-62]QNI99963.1 hypothetical protein SynA1562_01129 [Synechococcus sp. A15-62]